MGIQANASPLSPEELDGAQELAEQMVALEVFNPLKFLEVAAGRMKPIWKRWHSDWRRSFKKGKAMAFPFFMEGKIPVRVGAGSRRLGGWDKMIKKEEVFH